MKRYYSMAGISRQAYHQHCADDLDRSGIEAAILKEVAMLRQRHPAMGARKMYRLLEPLPIGRDKFEALVLKSGYRVTRKKNHVVTTHRHRKYLDYPNLMVGLAIQSADRVWVSDITYFRIRDRFCYLIFEMDLYSRRILGCCASTSMESIHNVTALEEAFSARGKKTYGFHLIHHSDAGSQYLSDNMIECLKKHQCQISTCTSVYENSHMERVNGTIKNEYLHHMSISSIDELRREMTKAVWHYNYERPHWGLAGMSPIGFETHIRRVPIRRRPALSVFVNDQITEKE